MDTNLLTDPSLDAYLPGSRSNKVVVAELVAMEMSKKSAAETAPDYLRILCRHPRQVVILRDSYEWHNQSIRSAGQARSLICKEQTDYFPEYCVSVYNVPQDPRFTAHQRQEEQRARRYVEELTKQSANQEKVFTTITKRFSASERAEMVTRTPYSQSTVVKLLDLVNFVTIQLLDDAEVPLVDRPRNMVEARETYLFRYALCMILLYTRWMIGGGKPTGKRVDRLTNDVVDMQIVASSTFFGGLLSHDRKPVDVSREARRILRGIRAFVG